MNAQQYWFNEHISNLFLRNGPHYYEVYRDKERDRCRDGDGDRDYDKDKIRDKIRNKVWKVGEIDVGYYVVCPWNGAQVLAFVFEANIHFGLYRRTA